METVISRAIDSLNEEEFEKAVANFLAEHNLTERFEVWLEKWKDIHKQVKSVRCDKCGLAYSDQESIKLVSTWLRDEYAPCPWFKCTGQMRLLVESGS